MQFRWNLEQSMVLPTEPWVGQKKSMHALPTARNFFLICLLLGPFNFIFSESSPSFFDNIEQKYFCVLACRIRGHLALSCVYISSVYCVLPWYKCQWYHGCLGVTTEFVCPACHDQWWVLLCLVTWLPRYKNNRICLFPACRDQWWVLLCLETGDKKLVLWFVILFGGTCVESTVNGCNEVECEQWDVLISTDSSEALAFAFDCFVSRTVS